MAGRVFQNVMMQFKDIIERTVGLCDDMFSIIACTDVSSLGDYKKLPANVFEDNTELLVHEGYTYKAVYINGQLEYVVFCEGEDTEAEKNCKMIAVTVLNVKQLHDEKYNKASFIKNLIMDNILPSDVHAKSKELHLQAEVPRVVFLIRTSGEENTSILDVIRNMFPEKNKDFVIQIDEKDIVLIKEVKMSEEAKDYERTAKLIADTLSAEAMASVTIGIGTKVLGIKDLPRSYKEAQVSLEVGKVFDTEKPIINYASLGIGRLIYQLPTKLCEIFLSEVFQKCSIDILDHETIVTIQKFFENNLNVSETSRKLFVHRNTLVYRLDKIKKLTGLDLRYFDQAIVFKVAMMVNKYLNSNTMQI